MKMSFSSFTLKKILKLISLHFFLFVFVNSSFASQNNVEIRVGIYENHPLVSQNANAEPEGLFIDILKQVALRESWELKFIPDNFSNCLIRLNNSEIDLMTAIAKTDERELLFDFSKEIVCTLWGNVYVQSNSKIKTILELEGKKIAIVKKGVFGEKFKKLCKDFNINCIYIETPSQNASLELLKKKKVDAATFNNAFKQVYYESDIKETSIVFSPMKIFFATRKGTNHELLNFIDTTIKDWKKDNSSFYYKSLKKWLGSIEVPKKYIPRWFTQIFITSLGIIVISLVYILTLQYQIKRRKKVEQALKYDEEKFRSLSDAAFEGIAITEKGTFLEVNNTMAKMFGYQTTELVGMAATDLVAPEIRKEIQNKILSGYEKPYESIGEKKDGTSFPIEVQAKMFSYKGKQVRITAIRDLSEYKQALIALRNSEEMLSLAGETGNLGMWGWRIDLGRLFVSENFYEITGLTEEETHNFSLELWLSRIHPDDREQSREKIQSFFKGETKRMENEIRFRHPEKGWIWLYGAAQIIEHDKEGKPTYLTGVHWDITKRKQAEEEREKLINELQEAIKEIKTLRGILPLCSFCKKIRDDKGYWEQVDVYIHKHSQADISHSVCPECMKRHYPDIHD